MRKLHNTMIKIGNLNIGKMYLGTNDVKVYLGSVKLYPTEEPTPPTPSGNCYEVIQTPIASYTSTTESVYSFADLKWYMKNNLNQYEEYGIYETGTSLSNFTYYPNKLAVIGETEYQYQENDGWVEVGEYIDSQTTYEVTDNSMALEGKTLSTTFKIPYADVENIGGNLDFNIITEDGDSLHITSDSYEYIGEETYEGTVTNDGEYYYYSIPSEAPSSVDIQETEYMNPDPIHLIFSQNIYKVTHDSMALQGNTLSTTFKIPYADIETIGGNLDLEIMTEYGVLHITTDSYNYEGEETYEGTVTNDGEYYYYSLPSEAPSSIVIQDTQYGNPDPIHLISSSKQISVEYIEKKMPLAKVYNTVAEMEAITCPDVGISQYGVVGNNLYQFEKSEGWVNKVKNSLKFVAKYNNGYANVIECNASNELTTGDTEPSYLSRDAMIEAYIGGDCVTSISNNVLRETWAKSNSLTSVTIGDGVTSIGSSAFEYCKALESVTIGNSVTNISNYAFAFCSGLTSIDIPSGVTNIGKSAFEGCSSLTSVNIPNGVTSISERAFRGCSGLTSVTIGNSVTSIGQGAFTSCRGLTSVTIPSSVTSISNWAFSSCKALTSVTVNATTPPTLGAYAFDGTTNISQIYVPSESVDAYKAASGWSTYASRIQAIPT